LKAILAGAKTDDETGNGVKFGAVKTATALGTAPKAVSSPRRRAWMLKGMPEKSWSSKQQHLELTHPASIFIRGK
jgi:hypothetical protein